MALPGLSHVGHHVREAARLAPVRPALWLGLRTALATAVPLVAASLLDPTAASWAPLAGFIVALADKGGAYRSRAQIMASVGIGGLIAVVVGSLLAGHGLFTAVPVAIMLGVCALAQAWGPQMVTVGNSVAIQLLVAASLPCTPHEALERGVGFAAGGAFALVLGLVVWPVRVYKPGRRAVSAAFDGLARLARAVGGPREDAVPLHRGVRDQIEIARGVLAATRRGRRGETGRGERLLALVQLCDQVFGLLVGIEEALDAGCPPRSRAIVTDGLASLSTGLFELAALVLAEDPPAATTAAWSATAPDEADDVSRALATHALALLARAHEDRAAVAHVVASLADDSEPLRTAAAELPTRAPAVLDELVWRHAIRVAVVSSIAMILARELELEHRYWVTMTAYILMTPIGAQTRVRALQRVAGTVIGCGLAAAIPWAVGDPRALLVVITIFAGTSVAVLQINYALYALFMTPTFMLLAELHAQDPTLLWIRIANTLIGAGLVVAGSLLWPVKQSARFDDAIAAAYDAAAAYLDCVASAIAGRAPQPSPDVIAARRALGLAINRGELALDALVGERAPAEVTEPRMTQALFLRRIGSAITTLASTRTVAGFAAHHVELAAFTASAGAALRDLAAAARGDHPARTGSPVRAAAPKAARSSITARPHVERTFGDAVLAARIARIDGALATLTAAALRAAPDTLA